MMVNERSYIKILNIKAINNVLSAEIDCSRDLTKFFNSNYF